VFRGEIVASYMDNAMFALELVKITNSELVFQQQHPFQNCESSLQITGCLTFYWCQSDPYA
jgi:hypothetical protein